MHNSLGMTQRKVRIMNLSITGATAVIGEGAFDASCVRSSAGIWVVTPNEASVRVMHAIPVPKSTDCIMSLGTMSASSAQIKAVDGTDGTTAKDVDFNLMLVCFDTADQV